MPATCSTDGCERDAKVRGMCQRHYQLKYKAGTIPVKRHKGNIPQETEAGQNVVSGVIRGWPRFIEAVKSPLLGNALRSVSSIRQHGDGGIMLLFPAWAKGDYDLVSE